MLYGSMLSLISTVNAAGMDVTSHVAMWWLVPVAGNMLYILATSSPCRCNGNCSKNEYGTLCNLFVKVVRNYICYAFINFVVEQAR